MALKLLINNLEEVPEELRDAYTENKEDDGFILDYSIIAEHPGVKKIKKATDDVDKKRRNAEKALKEANVKYGGIDLDAYNDALKKIETLDDKELLDGGKIDELVEKRVSGVKSALEEKINILQSNLDDAMGTVSSRDKELADIKIYDAIKDSALSKGARKDALTDISNRARGVWQLEDGKPVAKNGDNVLLGKSAEPLTVDEWVDTLSTESSYLFEPNSGGGATGNESANFSGAKVLSMDGAQNNIEKIANGEAVISR